MQKVFERFKELFEKRYSLIEVSKLGEDSVRYDFFTALREIKKLEPWQLHLEYPVSEGTYHPRKTVGSKRKENPQVDLWIHEGSLKLCIEFGFFRRNSNDKGSISVTENVFKMLNDFIRIAIQSKTNSSSAYFICVADQKMLNTELYKYDGFENFPAPQYIFDWKIMNDLVGTYTSAKKIDDRFLQIMKELKMKITANQIFKKEIFSKINTFKTEVLIWEVTSAIEK